MCATALLTVEVGLDDEGGAVIRCERDIGTILGRLTEKTLFRESGAKNFKLIVTPHLALICVGDGCDG